MYMAQGLQAYCLVKYSILFYSRQHIAQNTAVFHPQLSKNIPIQYNPTVIYIEFMNVIKIFFSEVMYV